MRKWMPLIFLILFSLGLPALGAYVGHRLTYLRMRKQPWQVNSIVAERVAKWRQNETMAGAYAIAKTPLDGVEKCYYTPPDFSRVTWTSRDMPTPFVGYAPQPGPIASGHINSLQFRCDQEIDLPKPKGVYRIFLVGGSTAFGAGASCNATTVGGYLEKHLTPPPQPSPVKGEGEDLPPPQAELFPPPLRGRVRVGGPQRVEVITAACSGWTSTHERIIIENRITELEPDLVIHLSGHNDAFFNSFDKNILWSRGYQDDHHFTLLNSLMACNFNDPYPDADPGKEGAVKPELVAQRLAHNITLAHAALRSTGARHVFALQPIIAASRKSLTPREEKMAKRADQAGLLPRYDAIRQKLSQLDLADFRFIDLTDIFDELGADTDIFLDGCHFGDRGNELIAKALAERLGISREKREWAE